MLNPRKQSYFVGNSMYFRVIATRSAKEILHTCDFSPKKKSCFFAQYKAPPPQIYLGRVTNNDDILVNSL